MSILDIIIIICLIPAIIKGVSKGFAAQIISIIALIAGVWLSFKFAGGLCTILAEYLHASQSVLSIIAFSLILIGTVLIITLAGKLVKLTIKFAMLDWLDKTLGAIFSLIKVGIILGLLIILVDKLNAATGIIDNDLLNSSPIYCALRRMTYTVFPYLKQLIGR